MQTHKRTAHNLIPGKQMRIVMFKILEKAKKENDRNRIKIELRKLLS